MIREGGKFNEILTVNSNRNIRKGNKQRDTLYIRSVCEGYRWEEEEGREAGLCVCRGRRVNVKLLLKTKWKLYTTDWSPRP